MIPLLASISSIVVLGISAAVVFILWAITSRKKSKRVRFIWWLPICAAIGSFVLFLPTLIFGGDNNVLYIVFIAPAVGLIFLFVALIQAIRRKGQYFVVALSMLVVYGAVSWVLFKSSHELHSTVQWLFWSKAYRAKVLAQPTPTIGELRHIEWDGWGFAGSDTVEYLVFDPNNLLSAAAKSGTPGKFSGIPCEVARVGRLESNYYTVEFYTDTDWEHCTY